MNLLMAACMLSVAIFAQKTPKGRLLSYSHTSSNPEIPIDFEFNLSWNDGKGTLSINDQSMDSGNMYTAMVSEDVFREVADIIKKKKLYTVAKKKKDDSEPIAIFYPGRESFSLTFEDTSVSIGFMDITLDQRQSFDQLEKFIKERSKESLSAEALSGYTHKMKMKVLPPDVPDNYMYQLASENGKTTLMINDGGEDSLTVDVPNDVFGKVFQLFNDSNLYKADNIFTDELINQGLEIKDACESVSFRFKNGSVAITSLMKNKHCKAIDVIDSYLRSVYDDAPVPFPEGKLTYCSCAYTNYGLPAGEIQHSYYELIADEGKAPKVIYCEDRGDSKKTEYRATQKDVTELSKILREKKIFKLNGYNVDVQMTGGTSYRIHMEFSSGEKLNANWFTHRPKALASDAYNTILRFMKKVTKR